MALPLPSLQPTLSGERVQLRPLQAGDWNALFAVASDPLIWAQHPANDRYQETVFRAFFDVALASHAAFVVLDAHTGAVIGSTRFHGYHATSREVEIGWTFLARSHWGGQCNGEMKRLLLAHAFEFVDRVIFIVGRDNVRSRTAMERVGGIELPGHRCEEPGKVVYGISRPPLNVQAAARD